MRLRSSPWSRRPPPSVEEAYMSARRKDISEEFLRGLNGMTENRITIEELVGDCRHSR